MKISLIAVGAAVAALNIGIAHAAVLNGHYDGFSDGFSLNLLPNGSAAGVETCSVSGTIAGAKSKFRGAIINEAHVGFQHVYVINRRDHTWALYANDGSIFQSGTWTETSSCAAARAAKPTGVK
jgi:hypothetical protein